ncbi:MAG: tetratricopeptide repeat protein [Nitrospirae bacterium]|nr:tetratricopeptide repeat protein [Nitrospirota bacterium]
MFNAYYLKGAICISLLILILFAPTTPFAQIPTEAEVHNRLGNEYCDRGEFNKAIKEYEEAVKIYPKYVDAYYNLGVTYYHDLKDYQKAAHNFQKFLEYEPESPDSKQVQNWLNDIEKTHGITPAAPAPSEKVIQTAKPEPIKEPVKRVEEIIPAGPSPSTTPVIKPEPVPSQAKPSAKEPQPEVAKKQADAEDENYKKALAHKNQGNIYSKDGNFQMAVREYHKALELRPDYTDALYNLAKTYDFDMKDYEQAIKYYETFLKYEPPNTPDAKEVNTWLLKARMNMAKSKETASEKKVAGAGAVVPVAPVVPVTPVQPLELPQPVQEPKSVTKPSKLLSGVRFEDKPLTKGLLASPAEVAAATPDMPLSPVAEKAVYPVPAPVPVDQPQPPSTASSPAAKGILLTSYIPGDLKSVQSSVVLRAEMKNELLEIFKSKNAPDPDKLAQLFMTKLRQDTLQSGDEVANIEIPGEVLANIQNIHILSHSGRIELNNEKGNLFRSPQTVQTRKRLQAINEILENGYEIKN